VGLVLTDIERVLLMQNALELVRREYDAPGMFADPLRTISVMASVSLISAAWWPVRCRHHTIRAVILTGIPAGRTLHHDTLTFKMMSAPTATSDGTDRSPRSSWNGAERPLS
jgi:hypothetical protein